MLKPKEVWEKVSLWRLGAAAGLLCIALIVIITCPDVGSFFNLKIALFVYGVPFFMLLGTYQKDFLWFIPDACLTLFSESKEADPLNADICQAGIRNIVGAGIVATVGMIIWILLSASKPAVLATGMADGVMAILYAFLAAGVLSYLYDSYTRDLPEGEGESDEGDAEAEGGQEGGESNTTKNVALGAGMIALIFATLFSFMVGVRAKMAGDPAKELGIEGEMELLGE